MTRCGSVKSIAEGKFTVTFPNILTLPSKAGQVSASEDCRVGGACFGIDLYPRGVNETNRGPMAMFLTNRSELEVACDVRCEIMDFERTIWQWEQKSLVLSSGGRVCLPREANSFIMICGGELVMRLSFKVAEEKATMITSDGRNAQHSGGTGTLSSDLLGLLTLEDSTFDFLIVVPSAEEQQLVIATGRKGALRDTSIPVHKLILAARSPVFRAMLSSGMKESCADEMEITGYAVETVRAFVRFLYSDACAKEVLEVHGWELLALADKYDVPALRGVCESHLVANMTVDTTFTTLQRANLLNVTYLKKRAMEYIVQNAKTLTRKPHLLDELSAELLREVLIAVVEAR